MANSNKITSFRQKTGLDDNEKAALFQVLANILKNQDLIMEKLQINLDDDDGTYYNSYTGLGIELCMAFSDTSLSRVVENFEEEE